MNPKLRGEFVGDAPHGSKDILFMTGHAKEALLETLLAAGHQFSAIVVPRSEKYRPNYEKLVALAVYRGIPVICAPTRPERLSEALKHVQFSILLSCGYPFLIPREVFSRARYAVNFHPTLLPRHRGRYLHWVLIDQDRESGVTAHLIDDSLDTGPIIEQVRFKVSPFDTIRSLARKAGEKEIELVHSVLAKARAGAIHAVPQDAKASTSHFEKRTPEDSRIDASRPLQELYHKIRACDPELYPAFFEVEGQRVYIRLYRKDKPLDESDLI